MKASKLLIPLLGTIGVVLFLLTSSASPQAVHAGPLADTAGCPSGCNLYLPIISKANPAQISGIEFTQAIQSLNNGVPLVAGRPTLARVTLSLNGASSPIGGIFVQLHALRNGVELSSSPISNSSPFTAPVSPNRGNLNDTLNLWLPPDWTGAPVSIYATVNGGNRYPSSGTFPLNFVGVQAMTIVLVPLQVTIGGAVRTPSVPASEIASWVYQTYPLAQSPNVIVHSTVNGGSYASSIEMWNNILNVVTNLHAQEDPATPNKEYFGVVNVDCSGGCISGIGWIGSPALPDYYLSAVGFDGAGFGGNAAGKTAIHEIGHTHGRQHAYCGASSNYYPPNTTGQIDDWGFNILTGALYNPANTYDFMSYCGNVWTSKFGYQSIFNFRAASGASTAAARAEQDALAISGWLNGAQVKVAAPFSMIAPLTPDDPQGEYRLELRDSAERALHSVRFNLRETDRSLKGFHLNVPSDNRAQRIALYRGTRLIFEQQASNNLRVNINTTELTPSDPQSVSWNASGALAYMVRASRDGGRTWQVLGTNLSASQLKLDSLSMPGGDVLIEVQASDGVHVVKHQAQTHVSPHAPQAQIAHKDFKDVRAGQPLALIGIAHDAEDGALRGNAVRWSSDRDGALGTGTTLWLARGLSAGTHTISMTITDSDGNTSSDQLIIPIQ